MINKPPKKYPTPVDKAAPNIFILPEKIVINKNSLPTLNTLATMYIIEARRGLLSTLTKHANANVKPTIGSVNK